ncbi:hypothetical protein [Paludisphaera rhizosphaerae]|uniref:hypothetical protein n=1 Tax=Paludisphaera rhizosphaerae TaxID=2711216 RepID=UPI0013EBD405|nr:hypothetical protein [Paludisphaera rhizosphaerae]
MNARSRRSRRRGLTSVVVLVLLFVISLVAASLVRVSVAYHQRTRSHELALQSELLADAGLDRALAKLSSDPNYTGERWDVPAEALGADSSGGKSAAVVTIEVVGSPGENRKKLKVQADYPPDPPRRVRSSREIMLP